MTTLGIMQSGLPGAAMPVPPNIRQIDRADLRFALAEGWRDFRAMRGDLLLVGVLYPLIGLVTAALFLNGKLLPLVFPLVAGLSILGPAVASGFYELARRREEGEDAGWSHFLDPLGGRGRAALAMLTGILCLLFLGWLAVAYGIYQATLGRLQPVGLDGFIQALFATREGWSMILLGNLAGATFAIVTLVVSVVSFPLVVDKPVDAGEAVTTSIRAVRENQAAIAQWGLRVAALLVIGTIPAFIGLAVVLPVLGYATWHLYTRLVER